MTLRDAIHAGLARATTHLSRTYAQMHPWFDVDANGNSVYATPLFTELDDILADIDPDELAEGVAESPQTPVGRSQQLTVVETNDGGIACDRSQSMGSGWRDGPLAQAAQSGSILLVDEVNRGPGR